MIVTSLAQDVTNAAQRRPFNRYCIVWRTRQILSRGKNEVHILRRMVQLTKTNLPRLILYPTLLESKSVNILLPGLPIVQRTGILPGTFKEIGG